MDRFEYDGEIETVERCLIEKWAALLPIFREYRQCGLGLCDILDSYDLTAQTAMTAEAREKAGRCAATIRAERKHAYEKALAGIDHMLIHLHGLTKRREGDW